MFIKLCFRGVRRGDVSVELTVQLHWWLARDVEGNIRGLIRGTNPNFVWCVWVWQRKMAPCVVSVQAISCWMRREMMRSGPVMTIWGYHSFMIWYLFNRSWVDTRWQHHTTHLQQTRHTIYREYNSGSAGRAPSLRVIPWHLPYNWGKSTEKTSVRVAQYKNNEQAPEPWNTIS